MSEFSSPMRRNKNFAVHPRTFDSLAAFSGYSGDTSATFSGSITFGSVAVDFQRIVREDGINVIWFSGAKRKLRRYTLPYFSGLSITEDLGLSHLAFSDPALYLDDRLLLGWYAGTQECDPKAAYRYVIRRLIPVEGNGRNTVFIGGSGGGFAALRASFAFPDALCIVWNPQIRIASYDDKVVNQYTRTAFNRTMNAVLAERSRFNLIPTLRSGAPLPSILYIQNNEDAKHIDPHLNAFLGCFSELRLAPGGYFSGLIADEIYVHMDHYGPGHRQPPPAVIAKILAAAKRANGDWSHFLKFENIMPLARPTASSSDR